VNGELTLGSRYLGNGRCRFQVWAPLSQRVEVHLVSPQERLVQLTRDTRGYHHAIVDAVEPGHLYLYRLDGTRERPDPASRFQPQGVHGPSEVAATDFPWEDGCWYGLSLQDYIIYELHVGAFSHEGTFDAVIAHLDELREFGVTAIELMPVAQFPGNRNWGYDGVYPFAVQNSYGGPNGLKRLVSACHRRGMAAILDVVYNHLGPEGNYLAEFGPYFTDRYHTPWGPAMNFDGRGSDEVRRFFIENALYWVTEFHFDALRLDALHAIVDLSAYPFLEELAARVHEQSERIGRRVYLIAESDLNDTKLIRPRELGGYGLDAQWNDDFHHALHALLTGERSGYYQDFGAIQHLARAFTDGYVYSGDFSTYRGRRHGNASRSLPARQFVVCSQNHDQVGNRMLGERLSQLVCIEGLKLAAATVLLSPFIPLLFMGEEYGEAAPFLYFINHSDPGLVEAVRRGRRDEFAAFQWQGDLPDPQDQATFSRAGLSRERRLGGHHRTLFEFYGELIRVRNTLPALSYLSKDHMEVIAFENERAIYVRRWRGDSAAFTVFHFGDAAVSISLPVPPGRWERRLDSREQRWAGPGSPTPVAVTSDGDVTLPLGPKHCVVVARTGRGTI
jgi:maltooligosyltrehalose trehalohydrolase